MVRRAFALMRGALCACCAVLVVAAAGCGSSSVLPRRSALPSCGESRVADTAAQRAEVADCFFRAARAGRQTEIVVTSSSVEGKKVQEIDRVLGPHSFEVFRREGSSAWSHEKCPALASDDTSDPRFASCNQV